MYMLICLPVPSWPAYITHPSCWTTCTFSHKRSHEIQTKWNMNLCGFLLLMPSQYQNDVTLKCVSVNDIYFTAFVHSAYLNYNFFEIPTFEINYVTVVVVFGSHINVLLLIYKCHFYIGHMICAVFVVDLTSPISVRSGGTIGWCY